MAHFPTTFAVKPDMTRGEIRVSIRVSEARIDEWWIPAADVREVLALEGVEGWRGDGSLRLRFNQSSADIALYDSGGNRTIVRVFSSAAKLLCAQLRAAVADVPIAAIEERIVIRNASPDEGVVREAVRLALQDEIGLMRTGIIDALRIEVAQLREWIGTQGFSVPLPTSEPTQEPSDTPTFIPSTVGQGVLFGSLDVESKTGDGVSGAAAALKAQKSKGKKK